MRAGLPALAAALLLLWGCAGGRQPVELRLRLEQGREALTTVRSEQTVVQRSADGREQRIEQESTTVYRLVSRGERADGSTSFEASWERLAIRIELPGTAVEFDSRSPGTATPGLEPLARLAGVRFSLVADRRGRVLEVRGLDAVAAELSSGDAAAKAVLDQLLTEEAVRASLGGFLEVLPPGPVRPGDWWEIESPLAIGGVRPRTRLTLSTVSRATCSLRLVSVIGAARGTAGGNGLAGSQEGTIEVDRATGRVTSGQITQRLQGTVDGTGGPVQMTLEGRVLLSGELAGRP